MPAGEIRFFLGNSAQGLRNDTSTEYRSITVEFLDPRVTNYGYRHESGNWDYGPSIAPSPVDAEGHFVNSLDLEKAVANDVQLLPGESLPATKRASLLIAITPVQLANGVGKTISLQPGEVQWREAGETVLTNTGPRRESSRWWNSGCPLRNTSDHLRGEILDRLSQCLRVSVVDFVPSGKILLWTSMKR